ncbi:MAG: zonular occludens toxin [Inoviridae sp.]|nr:MAG: zonular occludens toxin [Inoviridae sp.]
MPIMLINGANGHGKGQFAIKMILDYQKENDALEKKGQPRRQIFANIHGINQAGATPLKDVSPIPSDKVFFGKQDNPDSPPPEGYFVPPLGSVFFYDEAQKEDWIKQKAGALSNDIRVTSLEEHRHAGLDIIFITQSTNYIHSHITGLVAPHYYVERPLGLATTNVFMFNKFQKTPDAVSTRSKADDQFMISLGKKYGQYYKSSAQHNIKRNVPLKAKLAIGALLFCILFTVFKVTQAKKVAPAVPVVDAQAEVLKPDTVPAEVLKSTTDAMLARIAKLEQELYEARLPPDYQVTKDNPALRVAGVMAFNGSCRAYNAHGEFLNLTPAECDYYLAGAGRVQKSGNALGRVQSSNVAPAEPSSISTVQNMVNPVINPVS